MGNSPEKRVLLTGHPGLLGDSLEHTLNELDDVQLSVVWLPLDEVMQFCAGKTPDLVLIADDESAGADISDLTAHLLETYPSLPILRARLSQLNLLLYTSQSLPARMSNLIDAIHHLPLAGS